MVNLYTVEVNDALDLSMRGNFLRIVNKETRDQKIVYLNGQGKQIVLDYDVQAAVLDICKEMSVMTAEKKTLRAALQGQAEKIARLESAPPPPIPPAQDESLPRWIAYAERIKKLWT